MEVAKYRGLLKPKKCPPCPPCPPCNCKKIIKKIVEHNAPSGPRYSYAPPPDVVVLGTTVGPLDRTAMILLKNGRRIVVQEGSRVGKWKVARIDTDTVTFTSGKWTFAMPVTVNVKKFETVSYAQKRVAPSKTTVVAVPGFYTKGR